MFSFAFAKINKSPVVSSVIGTQEMYLNLACNVHFAQFYIQGNDRVGHLMNVVEI